MGRALDSIRPKPKVPSAPVFVAVRFLPPPAHKITIEPKRIGFLRVSLTILQWVIMIALVSGAAWLFTLSRTSQLFTVVSGSMEPVIHTGSIIAVSAKEQAYNIGDIIAYRTNQGVITHRIVEVAVGAESLLYKTKGDANNSADIALIPHTIVIGEARTITPYIGQSLVWLRTKIGFALIVLLPATIIILQELAVMRRAWQQLRQPVFATSTALFLLFAIGLPSAMAIYTSSVTITGNTFSTAAIFPTPTPTPTPTPDPTETPSPTPEPTPTESPDPCDTDIDIDQSNTNTGPGSTNENEVDIDIDCEVSKENNTDISNNVDVNANTGGNTSNGNTESGNQTSGDITIDLTINNQSN